MALTRQEALVSTAEPTEVFEPRYRGNVKAQNIFSKYVPISPRSPLYQVKAVMNTALPKEIES